MQSEPPYVGSHAIWKNFGRGIESFSQDNTVRAELVLGAPSLQISYGVVLEFVLVLELPPLTELLLLLEVPLLVPYWSLVPP
jgi:hypothetical protein